ncbi:MAG: phage tail assembly chaperone [Clostridium sp.]|nr:phage tail assembly chaperone [Clostridium sp.]
MKAESNLQPKNKFEIENIIDGKCEIVFFDNIQELEQLEDNEKRYSYDTYRVKTNYRDELEQELNDDQDKYNKWLELAKNTEYNELATKIREKRDSLLYATDKYTILDYPITKQDKEAILKYRQKLRDMPQEENFPYDVKFPDKPNIELIKTMKI